METLPLEIWETIFEYLGTKDLMNVLLVNSYWKEIIENSVVLMNNLPIFLIDEDHLFEENDRRCIEPLMESRRKVSKMIVKLKRDKIMKNYL